MKYSSLPGFDIDETNKIIESGTIDELIILPLSIGANCSNWKVAQDLCLKLVDHQDDRVSSNALLGLAYVARNHRKLEKYLVKAAMINSKRRHTKYLWRIEDAIEDINQFMNWKIGVRD